MDLLGVRADVATAKALKLDADQAKLEAAVKDMHGSDDLMSELAKSAVNVAAVEG